MQTSIGEFIRQLRRQKGLTQTELGATTFSKSYVSAVERGQINPSHGAIQFFSSQLDHPIEELAQHLTPTNTLSTLSPSINDYQTNDDSREREIMALLDLALRGQKLKPRTHSPDAFELSFDPALFQMQQKQARFAFLKGILAQETTDFTTAQELLEYALALSPNEYRPAILDALGTNAYQVSTYEQAVAYYLRAQQALAAQLVETSDLFFQIVLHCGNALCKIGQYDQALKQYEKARKRLRVTHNMQIAGQLYLGLGYSTYATLYQAKKQSPIFIATLSPEEVERHFQQALSFLLQGRTLYQVSSDTDGEIQTRLIQAMALLDLCSWRQQQALYKHQELKLTTPIIVNCASLFDEIDEQCRQIFVPLLEIYQSTTTLPPEQEESAYSALAFLMRSLCSRATIARLGGYTDTATRERSLASMLAQRVLDSLQDTSLSWSLINDAINTSGHHATAHAQSTLVLPDFSLIEGQRFNNSIILAEVCFAAGEISEEIAINMTTPDLIREAFAIADQCFMAAVISATELYTSQRPTHDPNYTIRFYQRYLIILEQRLILLPCSTEETNQQIQLLLQRTLMLVARSPFIASIIALTCV